MTLPNDAKSVAEWLISNHEGKVLSLDDDGLVADIAQVLSDFRAERPIVGLTPTLAKALEFIRIFTRQQGFSPSYAEIAKGCGIASKSGVARMVKELEERGAIVQLPYRHRSIQVIGRV